jgi:hypothetical protein
MFFRLFGVLMAVSMMFQMAIGWDELARAGWPFRMLLAKTPAATAVALLASGAVLIFQRRKEDDDDES